MEKRWRRAREPDNSMNPGNPEIHAGSQGVRRKLESVFLALIPLERVEPRFRKEASLSHERISQRARVRLDEGHLQGITCRVREFSLKLLSEKRAERDVFVIVVLLVDLQNALTVRILCREGRQGSVSACSLLPVPPIELEHEL